jgi:hypothetical protein
MYDSSEEKLIQSRTSYGARKYLQFKFKIIMVSKDGLHCTCTEVGERKTED